MQSVWVNIIINEAFKFCMQPQKFRTLSSVKLGRCIETFYRICVLITIFAANLHRFQVFVFKYLHYKANALCCVSSLLCHGTFLLHLFQHTKYVPVSSLARFLHFCYNSLLALSSVKPGSGMIRSTGGVLNICCQCES